MTTIRTEVDGRALARAFDRLPASIRRTVGQAVTTSARRVANAVRAALRASGRTGVVISRAGRGRKRKASAAGEAPARRTGALARSIRLVNPKRRGDRIARDVRARVAYSMALEHGRGGRAPIRPRPFLKPAREREAPQTFEAVGQALREALAEFGRGG